MPGTRRPTATAVRRDRVVSTKLADVETEILRGVITSGTGTGADTGGFAAGKTGTTENYGDAWFVGFNKRWTVAVWVGYPDRLRPMETEAGGGPVAGGTIPASIWRDFILAANSVQDQRDAEKAAREGREYVPPDQTEPGAGAVPGTGTGPSPPGGPADEAGGTRAGPRGRRRRRRARAGARRRGRRMAAAAPSPPPPRRRPTPAAVTGGWIGRGRHLTRLTAAAAATRTGCPRARSATAARPPS